MMVLVRFDTSRGGDGDVFLAIAFESLFGIALIVCRVTWLEFMN